jgi:FG-GAP-like repeat
MRRPAAAAVLTALSCLTSCAADTPLGIARAADASDVWTVVECADFDLDGLGDVLWYNPARNVITVWLMSGTAVRARGTEIPGPSGDHWHAVPTQEEAADFNLDGMADVLWLNPRTNLVSMWLMRGTEVLEKGSEIEGLEDRAGWDLGTVGDFDGDGLSGLLWANARSSSALVWAVAGTQVTQRGAPFAAPSGPGWVPLIGADYDGDFVADVLWYNAARNVITVWLMDGTAVRERGPEIPGPAGGGWEPVGAPDMNRDHLADMVWFNPARNVMRVWLMNGTGVLEEGPEIPGPSGGGYSIPTLVDFNGDELADVIWRNPATNRFAIWLMAGTSVLAAGPSLPGPD